MSDIKREWEINEDQSDLSDLDVDDNTVDDTEDYSMMEGDEPQAGTSTDGAGEGQGRCSIFVLFPGAWKV